MLILGRQALTRADGAALLALSWQIAAANNMLQADWHGFNLLHRFGGQHGALDVGFVSGQPMAKMLSGGVDVLWVLNAEGLDLGAVPASTFVILQGHHGDAAAKRADVILPGSAYTEKDAVWVNTEGRVQPGFRAVDPPGDAREDWKIIRAASAALGKPLAYDSLEELRGVLLAAHPIFGQAEVLERHGCADNAGPAAQGALGEAPLELVPGNYWQQCPISRASDTMAECARTYAAPVAQLAAE
jgi:NADH-quinone oxidoreductase subunit G